MRSAPADEGGVLCSARVMRALTALLCLWPAAATAARAQPPVPPVAEARRVSAPPVIDGRLDDAAWVAAPPIAGFRQREPIEGAEVSEPTIVRIVYDDTHLYIAADFRDATPAEIRASELRRDNTLESDDTFTVLVDTYLDRRNAFVFRVNPLGTRYDALVRNEARFYYADWDEQWTAAAAITESGWTAELAIPFKILRFRRGTEQIWGLDLERVIKRKNELAYWANWSRHYTFHNVSQAGRLVGLRDIRQAERVRVRPYAVAGGQAIEAAAAGAGRRGVGEFGLDDLRVTLTPNLTAQAAVNPDFAQTEADAQQVNLTRFSLFFPEKRQFFIEGADSLRMGVGLLHFGPPPLELVYTRTIGLSPAGDPVPVQAGGKLTGKAAGFDVGALSVQTGAGPGRAAEHFAVGRVRKEVLGRSYIGALATSRRGGDGRNTVVAADARFTLARYLNVMGLVARAADGDVGRAQWARQIGAEWRDDLVEIGGNLIDVDPQFTPGLGFVRVRERLTGVRGSVKPRPGRWNIRQLELTSSLVRYQDHEGALRSRDVQVALAAGFESGDRVEVVPSASHERVVRRFAIGPGVVLPPGEYDWRALTVTVRTYNGRKASGSASVSAGGFYDGHKRTLTLAGDVRPGPRLSLNPSYQLNDVVLGPGAFRTHLVGLRANVSFSTSLLTSAYVQYNSAGQLAATQVRVNYIFRTIDNLYIVFNETRYTDGPWDGLANRSLVAKVTYSLHR